MFNFFFYGGIFLIGSVIYGIVKLVMWLSSLTTDKEAEMKAYRRKTDALLRELQMKEDRHMAEEMDKMLSEEAGHEVYRYRQRTYLENEKK